MAVREKRLILIPPCSDGWRRMDALARDVGIPGSRLNLRNGGWRDRISLGSYR